MKIKKLLISSAVIASCVGLTACGGGKKNTITIAVGDESAVFYQELLNKYVEEHPEFGYKVEVIGADTGTAAQTIINDPEAAADIYTVAHDNIGKLVEANCALPLVDSGLTGQILADNPDAFKGVIYATGIGMSEPSIFAAPYISQALVLMYNKAKVSAEQAKTFEGLVAAGKANNSKSLAITGTDGFNFSFTVLARQAADNKTSVKLYENAQKNACYFQGDDVVATVQWAQDFFADPNGGHWPTDAGWISDAQAGKIVACIGGAWQFADWEGAVGSTNAGYTVLPTFEVNAEQVKGTSVKAGTKFQAGSFVDCKCLMLNAYAHESKYDACQELIKYMTSKEVQNKSFKAANNLPAYSGATEYIKTIQNDLPRTHFEGAMAQAGMNEFGIAQPFLSSVLNTYYYSKKAPELYVSMLNNTTGEFSTTDAIRKGLYRIEHIWQKGSEPAAADIPATLPSDVK